MTDTLVRELANGALGQACCDTRRALADFADQILVWRDPTELLFEESRTASPIDGPLAAELTQKTAQWLRSRQEQVPHDLWGLVRGNNGEPAVHPADSVATICPTLKIVLPLPEALYASTPSPEDARRRFQQIVNDPAIIRQVVQGALGMGGADSGLDDRWFAYHYAKVSLALWCAHAANSSQDTTHNHHLADAGLAADLLALLWFAEMAVTSGSNGKTEEICHWLYGDAKRVISSSRLWSLLPSEENVRVAAYFLWEQRGRTPGRSLDDWLSAEEEVVDTLWERL